MTSSLRRPDGGLWSDLDGAVLLAGGAGDLAGMRRIAAALSPRAHATVLVEAADAPSPERLDALGARVTWLVRGDRRHGERLAAAIHAWCAEWSCPGGPVCTVWLAARTPARIVRMTRALLPS